ncbi:DUF4097 family beta strand repeat-containing protein [Bacillus mesophilum]|uniref:DUF4097 domain-containing protein n=1 Tax=Bacillus mesophilum TaxID=1071718 RepID=A0A7V7RIL9_9BACI|nr:DUF4097 family beta strand repeat-containing protein [Bacillus mesophilum]KAB2330063.1 DUF4097 domain-containing protein [Bacillus mesophilum]
MKKISSYIFLAATALILNACQPFEGEKISQSYQYSEEEIKDIHTINIDAPSTKLIVDTVDDDKISVHLNGTYSGKEEDKDGILETGIEGSTFHAAVAEQISTKWIESGLELTVQIPEKQYEQVNINVTSKELNTSPIDAKSFNLISTSGDHNIGGFKGERFTVQSTSGDIKMYNITGQGNIEMTSGSLMIEMGELKDNLSILNTSGDITILSPQDASFFIETNVNTDTSSVDDQFDLQLDDGDILSGRINTPEETSPIIKMDTNSGKVKIETY